MKKLIIIGAGFAIITLWIAGVHYGVESLVTYTVFGMSFTKFGTFFFSCIVAPLWEELAFRHAPLQIAKKMGKAHKKNYIMPVVIISSALFGWGHGEGAMSILNQGVMGAVLCYVYLKNGYSFWSSTAVHFLWNFSLMFIFPVLN